LSLGVFRRAERMLKLGTLRGMTLVAVLLLCALPEVAAGQEPPNPSTAELADKIQSLRNQLDILREDVERRLGKIEASVDQRTNAKHREHAHGSSSASDNARQMPDCDGRTTDSLARYYDRHSDACCRHAYRREPCCRQVYHPQPCCGSIRDPRRRLSELD
jgi:hypothetical protein